MECLGFNQDEELIEFLLDRQAKLQFKRIPNMLEVYLKVAYFYLLRYVFTFIHP